MVKSVLTKLENSVQSELLALERSMNVGRP